MSTDLNNIVIISCNGSTEMGDSIQKHLGIGPCKARIGKFSNGEIMVEINESIRNKHAFVICSANTGSINDDLMQSILIADACNRSDVGKLTIVLPYFPYSRSDKKDKQRVPIGASAVAKILYCFNVANIVSMDLHSGQIQGFTQKGFHNIFAINEISNILVANFLTSPEEKSKYVLVSPDAGSIKRIESYANMLKMNYIIMHKQRDYTKLSTINNVILIGDEKVYVGKIGIVIDDMADTMGTMIAVTDELIKKGLDSVIIAVTHGIFSGEAIEKINNCDKIKQIICTNTISQTDNIIKCPKLCVIDVTKLLANVIERIETGASVSELFEKK
jgi:ribose-phosphate pyrophosphokinase